MRNRRLRLCALSCSVTAAMLAGCSAWRSPAATSSGVLPTAKSLVIQPRFAKPAVNGATALLYVGYGLGGVYIYDYQTLAEVGQLYGFEGANGMYSSTHMERRNRKKRSTIPQASASAARSIPRPGTSPLPTRRCSIRVVATSSSIRRDRANRLRTRRATSAKTTAPPTMGPAISF